MGYKCKPITEIAKSTPFKINTALVSGAATAAKGFTDAAGAMSKGMKSSSYSSKPTRTTKLTTDEEKTTDGQTSTDEGTTKEETTTNEE
jgi:hypothetical protein